MRRLLFFPGLVTPFFMMLIASSSQAQNTVFISEGKIEFEKKLNIYSIMEKMFAYAGNWMATLAIWLLPRTVREGLALYVFRLIPGAAEPVPVGQAQR